MSEPSDATPAVPVSPPATWGAALRGATDALAQAGITQTPDLDASVLLAYVVGASRVILLAYPERPLATDQVGAYGALIARRERGEPVAYLTGHREFMGLNFLTDARALIPRPETELLVEAALADLRSRLARGQAPRVADIGTGSGAIAIALAALEPRLPSIYATDLSAEALSLAGENARLLGVAESVVLLEGDLLAPLPEPVDLLLANLPYISPRDAPRLPPDVRQYEPALALYSASDGLEHLRRFLVSAPVALRPGGTLYLELGYDQRTPVEALARTHFRDAELRVLADYAGWDRVLIVQSVGAMAESGGGMDPD
jgi:release factor glutamine methyltransferase